MRNDLGNGNHWLELDLKGRISNRSAIGARVRVVAGALRMIDEVSGGSGYLSQGSMTIEFGLGTHAQADSVIVSWPSGYEEVYRNVAADRPPGLERAGRDGGRGWVAFGASVPSSALRLQIPREEGSGSTCPSPPPVACGSASTTFREGRSRPFWTACSPRGFTR
jgi:hypothetical protein